MSEHTKESWELYGNEIITGPNGRPAIARVHKPEHAHLLYAAPDLLEALEAMLGMLEFESYCMDRVQIDQANAAIAKARGQS
jgi:hypothetical protein